jgi:hypothetical protein
MIAGELPPRQPFETTRRRWLGLAALFTVIATFAVAGAALLIAPRIACGCTPVSQTPGVASPVDGIVLTVDAASLTDVRGFTLRTDGGFAFTFVLGQLENVTEFSPSHLAEHQASSEPIRVWFRTEGGERVAYRLEDAPG